MPPEQSLGLAQKLEEAAGIAQDYYRQCSGEEAVKYEQIWKCLVGLHMAHTGPATITHIKMVIYTK